MEARPLIGVTTYGRNADGEFHLPSEYVEAVRRAGGIPLLVPPGEARLEEVLTRLDGFVLAGGGDVDPALYGGVQHATIAHVDAERDAMEIALARQVVTRDLPALCICRGAQVLNVALGGSLIEHLPEEVGDGITHRPPNADGSEDYPLHPVAAAPDSKLAAIMGSSEVAPASWHHQAVRVVAPGLAVVARAADGVVEAVEKPDQSFLLAVQWHPEATAAEDPTQQRLFDALIESARARRLERG